MASPNVETFLAGMDAINRGDAEALIAVTDPEAVSEPLRMSVEGAYRGHEGARRFLADNAESFEDFRADYTELRELDDDRVLATGTIHVRGRGSEIETDVPTAGIATFRKGRILHWKDYGDAERARQAAERATAEG
ncbi:MAG TPA: nuclear transport factor 2 family protein [Solirubrobacterales bacterium]|nr:nuclear transport factor 2 family protein [Solirubrobacterales bacterium]